MHDDTEREGVEWCWEKLDEGFELSGDLITSDIPELYRVIDGIDKDQITHILMRDLEIEEGVTMALLVSLLRTLTPVVLIEAPKMLAHTLYKIDGLRDFTLVRPREGER